MGGFRIIDNDLTVCWPHGTPFALVSPLRDRGFKLFSYQMNYTLNGGGYELCDPWAAKTLDGR